ncbi:MAG: Copper binding cupredoxin [Frankiales bacterium]|nr:Copper binding cupredoxin [Frankiales bacterium]
MNLRLRTALVAGAATSLSVLLLAGCQSQSAINREPQSNVSYSATVTDGVQNVVITTDNKYRFTPDVITVHPGKVRITLKHLPTGGAPHDWQLQGFPADFVPLTQSGQTNTAEFIAPAPGRYQFVCTIHVVQGQTGTLVVLPN